ncbi:phosphoadenosine phosphosulfate reductase family protein [Bacillus cereus group sp. BceL300]|uniref:phosphoadenosine phosphosulfate reductase family protein n=1 Tax=Bacillus cereus group sp. BceL300 TaxID=3444985 RepID=UPI003F214A5D
MTAKNYDLQVQPRYEEYVDKRNRKAKRWFDTRADKETRYTHFNEHKTATIDEKERWSIELLKVALGRAERPVVSCSFGIDSILTLYLVRKALVELGRDPSDVDVIWNDTKNEFPAVRTYAKQLTEEWNLRLTVTAPKRSLKRIIDDNGGIDSSYFTARKGAREDGQPLSEKCCGTLKHEPMRRAKRENNWDCILVGLRADESSQRLLASLRDGEYFYSVKEWKAMVCRPILWWTERDIWDYVERENIPYNDLYRQNMIKVYPDNTADIVAANVDVLREVGIDYQALADQQLQTFTRRQSLVLKDLGFKMFTPRTGCMMCPIPIKYGYLQWMRTYYPKVYNAMIHSLGYGKALLDMLPQEAKDEIKAMTGIDVTAEDAAERMKEILEAKPCTFDKF